MGKSGSLGESRVSLCTTTESAELGACLVMLNDLSSSSLRCRSINGTASTCLDGSFPALT